MKRYALIVIALAIAALPMIGTTAEEETQSTATTGMSADEAAAASCARFKFGAIETEEGAESSAESEDENYDTDETLSSDTTTYDYGTEEGISQEASEGSSGAQTEGEMEEVEMLCNEFPDEGGNTITCYDGDQPIVCDIMGEEIYCPY